MNYATRVQETNTSEELQEVFKEIVAVDSFLRTKFTEIDIQHMHSILGQSELEKGDFLSLTRTYGIRQQKLMLHYFNK